MDSEFSQISQHLKMLLVEAPAMVSRPLFGMELITTAQDLPLLGAVQERVHRLQTLYTSENVRLPALLASHLINPYTC